MTSGCRVLLIQNWDLSLTGLLEPQRAKLKKFMCPLGDHFWCGRTNSLETTCLEMLRRERRGVYGMWTRSLLDLVNPGSFPNHNSVKEIWVQGERGSSVYSPVSPKDIKQYIITGPLLCCWEGAWSGLEFAFTLMFTFPPQWKPKCTGSLGDHCTKMIYRNICGCEPIHLPWKLSVCDAQCLMWQSYLVCIRETNQRPDFV